MFFLEVIRLFEVLIAKWICFISVHHITNKRTSWMEMCKTNTYWH